MDRSVKFWDRAAASYDREEAQDEPAIVAAIDKARTYLASGDVVLDVGCGTGRIAHAIAGDVARVHALDTSSRMIALAQAKAAGRGLTNVDYAHASLFDARYPEGSFDAS
jgi:ubiquinone/menaquinone biosynthesis C-methylase UbiE